MKLRKAKSKGRLSKGRWGWGVGWRNTVFRSRKAADQNGENGGLLEWRKPENWGAAHYAGERGSFALKNML